MRMSEGKPLARGTSYDPKPMPRPRSKPHGGRDWFIEITMVMKCQTCGIIGNQWTYSYPSSEDFSSSPVFDIPKHYRCGTCVGRTEWGLSAKAVRSKS